MPFGTAHMTISQPCRSLALIGVPFRKDIELLRCDFRSAASHSEAQRLCSPFSEMQSSRIVPLASAPAGARCRIPQRAITAVRLERFRDASQNRRRICRRLSPGLRHSETVRTHLSRADSESVLRRCDRLRRPRCAFGHSDPLPPLGKPDVPLRMRRSSPIRAHR